MRRLAAGFPFPRSEGWRLRSGRSARARRREEADHLRRAPRLAAWLPGCLAAWLPGCLAAWLPGCLLKKLSCA